MKSYQSIPREGKSSKQVAIYIIINGILSGEHVYGLPNHARKGLGVADWWCSTACFVLKFN
jgi:hypothetical protein